MKLENKSRCIKYKRDGGTTVEPETRWATRDFGAGCKREYVRVLRLIGKVNEPEYMNTDRESQCIKYERDVQLGEATRKGRTGKVLRLAQGSRCQTENLSVSNMKEMCSSGRLQGKRVQERS